MKKLQPEIAKLQQRHADDSQALCHVILEGTTVSRTVGRNGPAVIYSRSTSRFRATKPVVFDPGNGFRTLPARVVGTSRFVSNSRSAAASRQRPIRPRTSPR